VLPVGLSPVKFPRRVNAGVVWPRSECPQARISTHAAISVPPCILSESVASCQPTRSSQVSYYHFRTGIRFAHFQHRTCRVQAHDARASGRGVSEKDFAEPCCSCGAHALSTTRPLTAADFWTVGRRAPSEMFLFAYQYPSIPSSGPFLTRTQSPQSRRDKVRCVRGARGFGVPIRSHVRNDRWDSGESDHAKHAGRSSGL